MKYCKTKNELINKYCCLDTGTLTVFHWEYFDTHSDLVSNVMSLFFFFQMSKFVFLSNSYLPINQC